MKVGTDGVLLGAWADVTGAQRILDVGTGTGLIALMIAQRTEQCATRQPVQIHAIEVDGAATQQAQKNVDGSPWRDRIQVHHCPLQTYVQGCHTAYDLIVANPPFFEQAHKASSAARTIARHTDMLTPADLLYAASQLLTAQGNICVIYPAEMAQSFLAQGQIQGFVCQHRLLVKPTATLPIKRVLLNLTRGKDTCCQEETIVLEERRHRYTPEFTKLVKIFYLKA